MRGGDVETRLEVGVIEGETGYRDEPSDLAAFRWAIRRTLAERDRLSDLRRRRRRMLSVDHSLEHEQLARMYDDVRRAYA